MSGPRKRRSPAGAQGFSRTANVQGGGPHKPSANRPHTSCSESRAWTTGTFEENRAYRREVNARIDVIAERLARFIYAKHFHREGCAVLVYRRGAWREWDGLRSRFCRVGYRCVERWVWDYIHAHGLHESEANRLEGPDGHHILWGIGSDVGPRILHHLRRIATVTRDPEIPAWKSLRYTWWQAVPNEDGETTPVLDVRSEGQRS